MNIELLKDKNNKLKEESVNIISELLDKNWSYTKIGKYLEVSSGQVNKFCRLRNLLSKKSKRMLTLNKLKAKNKFQCRVCNKIFEISERIKKYDDYICETCIPIDRLRHAKSLGLEQQINKKLLAAKIKCRHINREFDLTKMDILELWNRQSEKCFYSGIKMSKVHGDPLLFSIDRIDSNLGYTKDNIVLCCWKINESKGDFNKDEFIEICRLVSNHLK